MNLPIKAGHVFCFSSGSYSDYGIECYFIARQEITEAHFCEIIDNLIEQGKTAEEISTRWEDSNTYPFMGKSVPVSWKQASPLDREWFILNRFIAELLRTGMVLELDVEEFRRDDDISTLIPRNVLDDSLNFSASTNQP